MPIMCPACRERPKGAEGHPGLRLDTFAQAKGHKLLSTFICDGCGAIWRRVLVWDGTFEWVRLAPPKAD
jgi:hypothetical protein